MAPSLPQRKTVQQGISDGGRSMRIRVIAFVMLGMLSTRGFAANNADLRLVEATKQGNKDAVRSLLKQHAAVNAPEPDGSTPLAWAAHHDDLDTAGLLIGAGANANAANVN